MNLAVTVFEIVAPVFLLAGLGFAWVKLGFEYRIQFVTRLAMTVAVPCLIFVALMQADIAPGVLASLSYATLATYVGITLAMLAFVTLARLDRQTYLAPMIFGNTGNLGLPLALFAFGTLGLNYAIVVFALSAILTFSFGLWLVAGSNAGAIGKVGKEPMVWAAVLGGIFLWRGWETPTFLTNALDLIGQMGIPLMLITLGVAVARLNVGGAVRAVGLTLVKLAICAPIAWATAAVFGLDDTALGILVLQSATPVAVTSYLLAEKYGADAESVAGLVVISTLTAVGSLPLVLAMVL